MLYSFRGAAERNCEIRIVENYVFPYQTLPLILLLKVLPTSMIAKSIVGIPPQSNMELDKAGRFRLAVTTRINETTAKRVVSIGAWRLLCSLITANTLKCNYKLPKCKLRMVYIC